MSRAQVTTDPAKRWKQLRKATVLADADAEVGQPLMLRYVSGEYTGALVAADRDGELMTNGAGSTVLVLDERGEVRDTLSGRSDLVRDAASDGDGTLLVDDQNVVRVAAGTARQLNVAPYRFANQLSVVGGRAAFADGTDVVVVDLARRQRLWALPIEPELIGGHTSQLAFALDPTGELLAVCTRIGVLEVYSVATGEVLGQGGGFEGIQRLAFSASGARLFAHEQYGAWSLLCYAVDGGALRPDPQWTPRADLDRAHFALDPRGERLCLAEQGTATVLDLGERRVTATFAVEHVVRSCAVAFVGGHLGVRTDRGCAGLYRLG